MPVRYEMSPEEFDARANHRREIRKLRRSYRRRYSAAVICGALLAGYVVVAVVWGVR